MPREAMTMPVPTDRIIVPKQTRNFGRNPEDLALVPPLTDIQQKILRALSPGRCPGGKA